MLLYIIIAVVVIAALIAIGAFFFTFEEYDDEEELNEINQVQEDPYAWAKAKQVPNISQRVVQEPVQQQVVQQTSQHPGWLWDAQTNQWVPDPNYVHNKQ